MLVWFLWLYSGKVPVLQNPKPVEPTGQVQQNKVVFSQETYICEVEAISPQDVRALLISLGASQSEVRREDVSWILNRTIFFKISIKNLGPYDLVFNPDQAVIGSGGRKTVASLLDMATFWPASLPDGHSEREKLASVFARSSVHIEPDGTHTQYLAFRAFGGRFPKKIYLELNDLYAGVDPLTIKCAFSIKYRDI